ncbi:MAG: CoA-binding protein [Candidatus Aenigmarchaeota archaeon]|nr:CoA-binding protein [Candidatus Aenigmarchaeota archaeon]
MANLDVFFNPKAIAVIGASRTPGKVGHAILENVKSTFRGKIYPINPNTNEILGLECFSSLKEIKEPIDLAIIAIPADLVKGAVEDCIKRKIKGVIIISAGFSEIGEKEKELALKKLSKNIRMIGPNCIGTLSPSKLDTMFIDRKKLKRPSEGSIGFITQSGAVGACLIDLASYEGVGVSKFISIGNKIDVDEIELLEYLGKDVETRCIVLYLESTEKGAELINISKKIVPNKPIIAFKSGKTEKGSKAVASHTGALAGTEEVFSAAFKQSGIIEAETTEDILDYAKILSTQPGLKSNKIAILTNGGGFGVIATDYAIKSGFDVSNLSKDAENALKKFLPKYASYNNPVDLTGDATTERYEKSINAILKDKEVSGLVIITLMQLPTVDDELLDVLRDAKMHGKPIIICAMGGAYTQERTKKLEKLGLPVYSTPERAIRAMKALLDYGKITKK